VKGAVAVALLCSLLVGAAPSGAASKIGSPPATFRLAAPPVAIAIGAGAVWVVVETKLNDAQLWQVDAATGRRLRSFPIGPAGPDIGAVTTTRTGVWAAAGNHIIEVDPTRPGRVRRVRLPDVVSGIAVGFGFVWATTIGSRENLLIKLSTATLTVRGRIRMAGGEAVAAGVGSVWVAGGGSLARVNPRTDRLATRLPMRSAAADVAISAQRLWLLDAGTARALDHAGRARRHLRLPFAAARLAVSNERLWAIDNCGCAIGQLTAIDLRTGRRVATWAVGATPVAVAAGAGQVWVASFGNSTLLRV